MFVDVAKVSVQAGRGGDGFVSFRHEIYVDKGGPDGGDGGKGGDVIFIGDINTNTLVDFRFQPGLKAKPGQSGAKRDRKGRSGENLIVKVPLGTVVKKDKEIIADITEDGQKVVIAKGGDGGFGNAHFKSSVRQAPRAAEVGEPGDTFEAVLELKLLADVGLVGFPNAGKSTFLSVVSNARPEIADYAFTTLTPNLGVADIDNTSLLIADIPGLIEGASKGKGLGDAFLRHVERTNVLLHLIDAYQDDVAVAYGTIREELRAYNPRLAKLPEVVALTKTEGLDQEITNDLLSQLQKIVPAQTPLFAISSSAHRNITEVLRELRIRVDARKASIAGNIEETEDDIPTIQLTNEEQKKAWSVERLEDSTFLISGEKIEKFARRTDYTNFHSVNRLRDIMRKFGIIYELERKGANNQSTIRIGNSKAFSLME